MLREPALDDGFTSIEAPTKTLARYSNEADAGAAIHDWEKETIAQYRMFTRLDREKALRPEPASQPEADPEALREACE